MLKEMMMKLFAPAWHRGAVRSLLRPMASRRLAETAPNVSSNLSVLEFKRTDGDSRTWPTNTTRIVDSSKQVNYMRYLDLDSPTSVKWRLNVARAIAMDKGMPGNETSKGRAHTDGIRESGIRASGLARGIQVV